LLDLFVLSGCRSAGRQCWTRNSPEVAHVAAASLARLAVAHSLLVCRDTMDGIDDAIHADHRHAA
jgi:hypothetical protein